MTAPSKQTKWELEGVDAFDGQRYFLSRHDSVEEAERAARIRLVHLELIQPTASSGGQRPHGIQDRVYIIDPDGLRRRIVLEPTPKP